MTQRFSSVAEPGATEQQIKCCTWHGCPGFDPWHLIQSTKAVTNDP